MVRLIDRNRQIPNGMTFYQPETKWTPRTWAGFNEIVTSLIAHRKSNTFLMSKHGWPVDQVTVENEVDLFNARICHNMGWTDYYTSDGGAPPAPFLFPPQAQVMPLSGKLSQLVAAGPTLVEWITSGAEAVSQELSNKRAEICSRCPMNGKGDWTAFFTVPVSNAIRDALNSRRSMNLSTPYDPMLGVCQACDCPLPLKIHMPIDKIKSKMKPEAYDALVGECWIRNE
jgi:hypothetical protein